MSDVALALLISFAIAALMFLWVPTLDICNARCQQILRGRSRRPGREAEALTGSQESELAA